MELLLTIIAVILIDLVAVGGIIRCFGSDKFEKIFGTFMIISLSYLIIYGILFAILGI